MQHIIKNHLQNNQIFFFVCLLAPSVLTPDRPVPAQRSHPHVHRVQQEGHQEKERYWLVLDGTFKHERGRTGTLEWDAIIERATSLSLARSIGVKVVMSESLYILAVENLGSLCVFLFLIIRYLGVTGFSLSLSTGLFHLNLNQLSDVMLVYSFILPGLI